MADRRPLFSGFALGLLAAFALAGETIPTAGAEPLDTGTEAPSSAADPGREAGAQAAGEVAKEEAPARPDWLSEAEQAFLDRTGGLRPIATYDSDTGTVTIKLKKPGLTFDQIFEVAIGPTYDYYKRTDLVETSFRGKLDGKNYLFTGTVAKKYMFGGSITVASVPVVTRFTQSRKPDHITITWRKPDFDTAKRFLEANKDRLAAAMKGAGIDEAVDDYLADILEDLPDTETIRGRHEYYPESGYYIYQQQAVMASAVANLIASVAGEGDIKGAALKVAYQVLREPEYAGPPGALGKKVVDMSGDTIAAGR